MKDINVIAGLGEIGSPILKLLSKKNITIGYDLNPKLMDVKKFHDYEGYEIKFLHICIPFNNQFIPNVISLFKKFTPKIMVIHSTISPNTTKSLQKKLGIPIIYSATRGVHNRMLSDLKKYTKYFAIEKKAPKEKWAIIEFKKLMKKSNVKTKKLSNPVTLELAKIVVDTTYYGWLINFAQLSNLVAKKYHVDYDEMWEFSDEINRFLGNRPKMFPGFIGGHCVIPNLSLVNEENFYQIDKINNMYAKKVKEAKLIAKKYVKGKQSYNTKP
ncbi:MAG: GDP-mannose dehydrogenase [Nitrosopumilaceae archaeon]